jgi:hypothetical protein
VIASPGLCAAAGVATARQAAVMTALIFMAVALLCPATQRLAASDFVRHLARWRFQLKAYRHAVEGIHIGNDGG